MAAGASVAATGGLGLVACTALVVGNMIGSGIFLLPASLAAFGPISLVGWTVTSLGALVLAVIFGRLSRIVTKTGGPYAYTEAGFGEFAGFIIAWGYWIALWTGNAGVAVALAGYVGFLFPGVAASQSASLAVALIAIWTLTLVNIRGVAEAGFVQVVTTVLKLVPAGADRHARLPLDRRRQLHAVQHLRPVEHLRHLCRRGADALGLSRPRVGDGAGGRRDRPRAHDPARHDPRRADRRRRLYLGHHRRDRRGALGAARHLGRAARRRGAGDVGRGRRRARRHRRGDLDLRHAQRLHAADRARCPTARRSTGCSRSGSGISRGSARRRTRWSSRTCSPRSSWR